MEEDKGVLRRSNTVLLFKMAFKAPWFGKEDELSSKLQKRAECQFKFIRRYSAF